MNPADRTETNRANSKHSTGPKTAEGKKKCSLNALRHGLSSQIIVMPTEDLAAYNRHFASFVKEYCPQGASEENLVLALADASWRLNRVAALETNLLGLTVACAPDPVTSAMTMAASIETHSKALANLSMHSQRLSRQFEKTVTLLRSLQATRREKDKSELGALLDFKEICENKGEVFDHSKYGFVFSEFQINEAIHARNCERLRKVALKLAAADGNQPSSAANTCSA